nr:unnamed protein product [Callosobruchus analis]
MSPPQEVMLDELAKRQPEQDEDRAIFSSVVNLIDENYPVDWREWKVVDISYQELFGESIHPKLENKVRLALPTKELIQIFNPNNRIPSEKAFKKMRRKLLTWPLTRSLLFAPQTIRDQIHISHSKKFLQSMEKLKPRISSRAKAADERAYTPSTPSAASTPKRTRSVTSTDDEEEEIPRKRTSRERTASSVNSEDLMKMMEKQTELFKTLMAQMSQPSASVPIDHYQESQADELEPSSSTENSFSEAKEIPESSLSWRAPSLAGR